MVAKEAVVVRVTGFAGTYSQRINKGCMFGYCGVIAPRSAGLVADAAILPAVRRTRMVPACRYPGAGAVALIAGKSRRYVTDMFAFCGPSIVASGALPRCCHGMIVASPQECGGVEVTAFAWGIGYDVTGGLRRRDDSFAERVTAITVFRRAFEYATRVAGFAGGCGVHAG